MLDVFNCRAFEMERTGTAILCDQATECCGEGKPVYRHVGSQYHYICTDDPSVDADYVGVRTFGIFATIVCVPVHSVAPEQLHVLYHGT